MGSRTAAELIREMDTDGDGVVDFQEFQRAMLGEPCARAIWAVGESGRYLSRSHGTKLDCVITAVDSRTGSVMINLKPGYWISLADQSVLLTKAGPTGEL